MVTRADYGHREVEASKSVLVELIHLLGEFKDSIVIVGGSVPPLLFPKAADAYVGTLDVDIALNHKEIDTASYQTIRNILIEGGYREGKQPYIFFRDVQRSQCELITVQVDLLSGEYKGTGKSHRTQKIQDVKARKARGCDLAFSIYEEVNIEAELPEGGKDKVRCKVSAIVPFIIMKGMALYDRLKEKDSWDIYYCLLHYPKGIADLVQEFRPFINNKLVIEGLKKIGEKFVSPDHIGPKHVADFEQIFEKEERERVQRDAFERVNYLLHRLVKR